MSKKSTKPEKIIAQISENYDKIKELEKAFRKIGISAKTKWYNEWLCVDGKIHCGIELMLDYGEDYSFIFTPDGQIIHSCLEAPLKLE